MTIPNKVLSYKTQIGDIVQGYWHWNSVFNNPTKQPHVMRLAFIPPGNRRQLTPDHIRQEIAQKIIKRVGALDGIDKVVVEWSVTHEGKPEQYERLTVGVSIPVDVSDMASNADVGINFSKAELHPLPTKVTCPYCGQLALYSTSSAFLYGGRDFGSVYFCTCKPDGVYVGCHKGTGTPLGSLADAGLRILRQKCHKLFDPYWLAFTSLSKNQQRERRNQTYAQLAKVMKIPVEECHMSMFDNERAKQAIKLIESGALKTHLPALERLKVEMFIGN